MNQVLFQQVVSKGCGLDVHKKVVVATIAGEGIKKATREFGTFTSSLTELRDWLLEHGITHVAMESTGVYWKPVYHILEPAELHVWVVNARHIKNVPGRKTDKKDSAWICKLLLAGLLKPSFIPPREQRELRDLTRYRTKLTQSIAANKNRVIRILEDCNVKLSSVLSHANGVVGTKLIQKFIDGKTITMDDIDEVYHFKLQATKEELWEACNGHVTPHHIYMLRMINSDITSTQEIISDIDARIKERLTPYDNVLALLREVPGVGAKSAEDLIAEIGLDMNVFPNEKHLASWVGISPGNNESAGIRKSGRITHGNKHAKGAIVEVAWAAIRTKGTFYSARYHRLAARRGKNRALIAIAHSILKSVYHILSGSPYRELGADYVTMRMESRRKSYLMKELENLGYDVLLTDIKAT
jgi:Transposase and inactivated derivatives